MQLDLRDRRAALVVVDVMAELAPGADESRALDVVGADVGIPNAVRVLEAARRHGLPVIHFKEVHRKEMVDFGRELDGSEPVHCLETWPETDYHPDTYPIDGEFPMQKRRYSCFIGTDLDILLRGLRVDTLLLVGAMTDVCVHYTFADAHQRDHVVHVVEDAVYGSSWPAHEGALNAMEYLQHGARITTDQLCDHLGATVRTPAEAGR